MNSPSDKDIRIIQMSVVLVSLIMILTKHLPTGIIHIGWLLNKCNACIELATAPSI